MSYTRRATARLVFTATAISALVLIIEQNRLPKQHRTTASTKHIRPADTDGRAEFTSRHIEECPSVAPNLIGPINVTLVARPMSEIEESNKEVDVGGHWHPPNCKARHRIAIIVPYRSREVHLRILLSNLHPFLRRQQIDYTMFVVEQVDGHTFNKGKLINVGFTEALKTDHFDCFIFHDVDLVPEDDRNIYSCPDQPRHMAVAVDKRKYRVLYNTAFGGVSALTADQFRKTNGMSNSFWGWGREDDEMGSRVLASGQRISRYPAEIARYKMIRHGKDGQNQRNPCNTVLGSYSRKRYKTDGLNSLNYTIVKTEKRHLYTWLLVDVNYEESVKRLKEEGLCNQTVIR